MIPLAVPDLAGNEKNYLDDCIDTTFVSSVGEYVNRFEESVGAATGAAFAVATSAGTTGLHAALTAVGVSHGDLVILPTFTFIASANAIRHCGADPWLMDISDADWCLDAERMRLEIEKDCKAADGKLIHVPTGRRVAAMMPVYTLGNIPDMDASRAIAEQYRLPLVVDAACAIGATCKGKAFGELADLSVLSFNGNKTVTCGGGGAIVGNNEELLGLVRHLTTTARVWPDYDFDMVGFNYRMTNIQAAVGCAQLERLNGFVERKRQVREYYESALGEVADITFFPATDGSSCWFSGIVLPENTELAETKAVVGSLRERGVEARPFWKPVHLQIPYMDAPCSAVNRSEDLWQRVITLPCSTNITDDELETVVHAVREAL